MNTNLTDITVNNSLKLKAYTNRIQLLSQTTGFVSNTNIKA